MGHRIVEETIAPKRGRSSEFPFGRETVIQLVATVVLPGLPLVLTVIPLEELVKRLLVVLL